MLGGLIDIDRATASSGGAEVTAFLARTSGLDTTHINAYTALINGLVLDGIWSKLDVLYIHATQDSTTALLNLVSTSYTGVTHGSPAFAVDLGYTGVDASGTVYIDTGFNAVTANGLFTRDAAHISAWNITNATASASGGGVIGVYFGTTRQTNIIPKYSDGNVYFRVNGANIAGVANATARGYYIANRSTNSAVQGYKDGSSIFTNNVDTSSALLSNTMFVLAMGGGASPFGGGFQIASASIGASLSSADATNFYTRLRTYMTAVGVP